VAIRSVNPVDNRLIEEFAPTSAAEIEAALAAAQSTFAQHRGTRFNERARRLLAVADVLQEEKDRWSRLLTEEMGKTLTAAVQEVEKCAWVCRYYAEHAEEFLNDQVLASDAAKSFVKHLPIGPVLAVMPWNFPFWQVFRFAAPAVMAGNVVLLKHASNVPRTALALQEIFARAGHAPGVFQALLIEPQTVEQVLADRRVKAATVTGSTRAGSSVAAIAGKHIKKTVLELGGSDAFIVMPSADLEAAVDVAVTSRTLNNGQSCIAAKRFIVHRDIYDVFLTRFVARFEALRVGDPLSADTDVGPLAMARSKERLERQVEESLARGAERVFGAEPIEGRGNFYRPGVLADIPRDAPVYSEEVFGPVALMFKAADLDEAIALANDNPYGLASAVWTRDASEADRAVAEIEAGSTFLNSLVKSDPRLPFGGVKCSGYGRELSRHGILEFVNRKTVSMA
jgi:succinate-semialdehyde dehydrogenase/glutarate-semialdehyde dehydrogenase